jgi:DNA-binding HxlR family transcriptional regulator/putative sterol carrier protein
VVGERWTLLLVRELLLGPKRYSDLQAGLPGIAPGVLAARLRLLEGAGVIAHRRLPPPAASFVYELTERGARLRPVLAGLFEWGMTLLEAPAEGEAVRASYWLPALRASLEPHSARAGREETYALRVGEEDLTVEVKDGEVAVHDLPAQAPDVIIRTDHGTFAKLGLGRISALDAFRSGAISVEGDPAAAERCAALFGVQTGETA